LPCIFPDLVAGAIFQAAVDQVEEIYDVVKNQKDNDASAIHREEWGHLIINNNYGSFVVLF
jgi:hypothetical protein